MKVLRIRRRQSIAIAAAAAGAALAISTADVRAGDATWNTNASGNWTDGTKWSTGIAPGSTGTTTNTDAVTVSSVVSGKAITLDAGRNINSLTFNALAGLATITGGSLVLTAGGTITVTGAAANNAVILSPITLAGDASFFGSTSGSGASPSRYLQINGGVTGTASTGNNATLTLRGAQAGDTGGNVYNVISNTGVLNDGVNGGTLSILKTDNGSWSINAALAATTALTYASGANTITFGSLPAGVAIGNKLVGAGITTGTTVTGVDLTSNTVTLSAATTAVSNTSGVQFTGFSGGVSLAAGILRIVNTAALGTGTFTIAGGQISGVVTPAFNNQIVWSGNFNYNDANSSMNLGSGSVSLGVASGVARTVNVGASTGTLTFGGTISGGTGAGSANSITKTGAGTLNLASNGNTFNGLLVTGGLVVASTPVVGTPQQLVSLGTPFGVGTITINGGGFRIGLSGGTPTGSDVNYGELPNDIVLAGNGVMQGNTTARNYAVYTGLISGPGKLTISNGNSGSQDANGVILRTTNTYTGGTDITSYSNASSGRGSVILDAVNALGGGAGGTGGAVTFVDSNFTGTSLTSINYLSMAANQSIAGLNSNRTRAYVVGYSTTTTSVLTINNTAGGVGDNASYAAVLGSGAGPVVTAVTLSTSPLVVSTATTSGYTAGNNLALVKTGSGTQTLSGLNIYTGGTTINGGTLVINGGATASAGTRSATLTASSAIVSGISTSGLTVGTFVSGTGLAITPSVVAIDAANSRILLSSNVTTGSTSANLTFSSLGSASQQTITTSTLTGTSSTSLTLSSVGGLSVGQYISANNISANTQITAIDTVNKVISLSGATNSGNSIASGTAITFLTTSGAGGSNVVVNNTGILAGSGAIAGSVTANIGGTVSPGTGNGVSALKTGNLSLAAGSQYRVDANLASLVSHNTESDVYSGDAIQTIGTVTLGGDLYFNFSGFVMDTDAPKTILLVDNDGVDAVNGSFANVTSNYDNLGPLAYTISNTFDSATGNLTGGNDVAVTFTSVPEPATASLAGLAAAGLLLRRRRQNNRHRGSVPGVQ